MTETTSQSQAARKAPVATNGLRRLSHLFGPDTRATIFTAAIVGVLILCPLVVYPVFLMKALCFALFACAFNLLLGFAGLLSFGHAAFFGSASYLTAHAVKVWGVTPEIGILFGTAVAGLPSVTPVIC